MGEFNLAKVKSHGRSWGVIFASVILQIPTLGPSFVSSSCCQHSKALCKGSVASLIWIQNATFVLGQTSLLYMDWSESSMSFSSQIKTVTFCPLHLLFFLQDVRKFDASGSMQKKEKYRLNFMIFEDYLAIFF